MIVYVKNIIVLTISFLSILDASIHSFTAHDLRTLRTPGRQEATLRRPAVPSHAVPGSPAPRPGWEEISRKWGEKGDLTMI